MSFVDKQLTCRDCSNSFLFTGGEQEFYASKGLQNEPVRCPPCRSARKSSRLAEPEDGYVKYGVFASFGGRTPRQMHPATCADCGIMTEVPFQPRGDRPVYCSACYSKIKGVAEADAEAAEAAVIGAKSGDSASAESEPAPADAEAAQAEATEMAEIKAKLDELSGTDTEAPDAEPAEQEADEPDEAEADAVDSEPADADAAEAAVVEAKADDSASTESEPSEAETDEEKVAEAASTES